jgi:hypothetical protein
MDSTSGSSWLVHHQIPHTNQHPEKVPCHYGGKRQMKGSIKYFRREHENTGPVLAVKRDAGHFAA